MISRCMNLMVIVALATPLVTCQFAKEGYVGVNFNAGGSVGGHAAGSGEVVHSYDKVYVEKEPVATKTVVKTVEVPVAPPPAAHASFYFEKNIQPIRPVLVEKEVEYKPIPAPEPVPVVVKPAPVVVHEEVPQNVYVRKVYRRPVRVHPRKHYAYVNAEVGPPRESFFTKLFAYNAAPAPPPTIVQTEVHKEVVVPQNTVQHYNTATYTASANVNRNGQFFNDIFNIPISTLKAVNNLVNNIAGGVTINKQVTTHAVKTVDANAGGYVHAEGHVHT